MNPELEGASGVHLARRGSRRRLRIIDPAYPAFNVYSSIARITTALGPVCIGTAASEMPGWDVEIIDENNYRGVGPRTRNGLPDHDTLQAIRYADVVGLYGGLSSTIPRLHAVARFYKAYGIPVIAGGQHFVGDNIRAALENGVEVIVLGEGEETTKELLAAIQAGTGFGDVAGIAYLKNGAVEYTAPRAPLEDLDRLPTPNFDLVRYAKIQIYPVGWVRGCGMDCEFCTVKGRPRGASPERVLEQIATALERHGGRNFFIVDDLFGQARKDTLRLCRLLAKYQNAVNTRLNLAVQIRLDRGNDTELLTAMRSAGVNTVAIGFESPIEEELVAMSKRTRPDDMLAMTRKYHKAGFMVHGMFIFGYPSAGAEAFAMPAAERVRRFRRFIRMARLDTVQVLLPVPLPGTQLTERLAKQGRIFPLDCMGWEYYDGNFPLFEPDTPMNPLEMQTSVRKIMGRFYRFRHMFLIAVNILMFPAMVFSLFNLRYGWRKWYRFWRNDLLRFGGWIIIRRWTAQITKGDFRAKLDAARARIARG